MLIWYTVPRWNEIKHNAVLSVIFFSGAPRLFFWITLITGSYEETGQEMGKELWHMWDLT